MTVHATVLAVGLLLLLPNHGLAQARNTEAAAAGSVDVEQEIHALEKRFNDSRARADVATLGSMLSDDWTVVHGDGTIDTKAQYLADLHSGVRKFSGDVKEDAVTIRVHGDTAVAAGLSDSKVEYKGRPGGGPLRFTRVYVKRDGRWLMIVSHATRRQP
jgi:ketosteroid isomerase-like protein